MCSSYAALTEIRWRHTATAGEPPMPVTLSRRLSILALSLTMCAAAFAATANSSLEYRALAGASPEPLPARGPQNPQELEAFIDGLVSVHMKAKPIAGGAVAVVKDGALYFSKGYGYADVAKNQPVEPARTLFRPGSVSKLITWTAVMQLVEQGKLDLDADVNTYVKDVQLPKSHSAPVTLRNLMTHTPGLEDGGLGYLMAKSEKDLGQLGEFLARHMPARTRAPTTDFSSGANASYSNWGTALAGHIVATVAGMPFDDYVERNIFQPLGMSSSTFREPLPAPLQSRMSQGYVVENGLYEPRGFEFIHNFGPAGSMSATVDDMAKFMLAHLQNGAVGDARILKPETTALMHARTMSPNPALNGGALGFYEMRINGRRVIGHGGDTLYFHSNLLLVPEANLGVFVSFNTAQARLAAVEITRAMIGHYFPAQLPRVTVRKDATARNGRYAGSYRALRHSFTKAEKVFVALEGDVAVTAMPDGTLMFSDLLEEQPSRWVEVGDGVFRKMREDTFIAFVGDDGGRATHMVGPFPVIAFERVAWYESPMLHGVLIVIAVVLFIAMLVSAIRRRKSDAAGARQLRWARLALAAAGVLLIGFLVSLGLALASDVDDLIFALPTSFYVALALPLLALLPIAAGVFFTIQLWRSRGWTLGGRVFYTATTVAALLFLTVLSYWNLLGYRIG
jgi:CubicO group peptidase (beta-lactamase class C family)